MHSYVHYFDIRYWQIDSSVVLRIQHLLSRHWTLGKQQGIKFLANWIKWSFWWGRNMTLTSTELYPTLRMNVMSPCILCPTWLKRTRCCQVPGKYARDFKKAQLKCLRACRDVLWCHSHSQSGIKFSKSDLNIKCATLPMFAIPWFVVSFPSFLLQHQPHVTSLTSVPLSGLGLLAYCYDLSLRMQFSVDDAVWSNGIGLVIMILFSLSINTFIYICKVES